MINYVKLHFDLGFIKAFLSRHLKKYIDIKVIICKFVFINLLSDVHFKEVNSSKLFPEEIVCLKLFISTKQYITSKY